MPGTMIRFIDKKPDVCSMKQVWMILGLFCVVSCSDKAGEEGDTKGKAGVFDAQIEALENAVQQNPDSAGSRLALVFVLDSAGKYQEAAIQMDSLLLRDSLNAGLWFAKAQLAENNGDTAAAVSAYRKSLLIYPATDNMLHFANLLAEGRDAESLEIGNYIKRLKAGREYEAHADFVSGIYYARTGAAAKADAAFDACIANNYTYMEAYIEKGLLQFDAGAYRKALEIFTMASKVNNLYADAYYYQARCYEMLQLKDSARLRFEQSLQLDKTLDEARAGLKRL